MIVRAAPRDHYRWIVERTGLEETAGMRVVEAVADSGRILAQIAGTGWTPNAVMIHIAVEEPMALRQLLHAAAVWIYEQARREVVLGLIAADNRRSLRLAKHIGMREVYRVKDGHKQGVDLVALEMRREDCRWLQHRTEEVAA
jgi:hypothetical protein